MDTELIALKKEWIRRYLSKAMICVKCHTTHPRGCMFRACKHFCCQECLVDKKCPICKSGEAYNTFEVIFEGPYGNENKTPADNRDLGYNRNNSSEIKEMTTEYIDYIYKKSTDDGEGEFQETFLLFDNHLELIKEVLALKNFILFQTEIFESSEECQILLKMAKRYDELPIHYYDPQKRNDINNEKIEENCLMQYFKKKYDKEFDAERCKKIIKFWNLIPHYSENFRYFDRGEILLFCTKMYDLNIIDFVNKLISDAKFNKTPLPFIIRILAFSYNGEMANVVWLIRKLRRVCDHTLKLNETELFDVGYRVVNYLFRLRDNSQTEVYRILNLIDEWVSEYDKQDPEQCMLLKGKVEAFFDHFYNGQYQQEDVEVGYSERGKLCIKANNEGVEEEVVGDIDEDVIGNNPREAMVKVSAVSFQGKTLIHEGKYYNKHLVGFTTEHLPDSNDTIAIWRGNYQAGRREGWFKRYHYRNNNKVEEYAYYVNGLRNGYSFTVNEQSYSTCELDENNCCIIEEYSTKIKTDEGRAEKKKYYISSINHYVNGLLDGYQFMLRGDGSIDQIDFYSSGELIPSKRYKFLGANVYVPLKRYFDVYPQLTKSDSSKGILISSSNSSSSSNNPTPSEYIPEEESLNYFISSDFYYWDYSQMDKITKLSHHLVDFDIRDYTTQGRIDDSPILPDCHPPFLEPVFQTRSIGGQNGLPFVRGIQVTQEGEETFMFVNDTLLTLIYKEIAEYRRKNNMATMFTFPRYETKKQLFYSTLDRHNRICWSQLGRVINEMTMLDALRIENIWFKDDDGKNTEGEPLRNTDKKSSYQVVEQEGKEADIEMDLQKMTAKIVHLHNVRMQSLTVTRGNKANTCNTVTIALSSTDINSSALREVRVDQVDVNVVIDHFPTLERVTFTDVNAKVSICRCHKLKNVTFNGKVQAIRISECNPIDMPFVLSFNGEPNSITYNEITLRNCNITDLSIPCAKKIVQLSLEDLPKLEGMEVSEVTIETIRLFNVNSFKQIRMTSESEVKEMEKEMERLKGMEKEMEEKGMDTKDIKKEIRKKEKEIKKKEKKTVNIRKLEVAPKNDFKLHDVNACRAVYDHMTETNKKKMQNQMKEYGVEIK